MGLNITEKLIASQLVEGDPLTDDVVPLRITQTLAHDLTGPLVLTQFEELGLDKIRCDLAVFYVDHDILANSAEILERQQYLRSAAHCFGAHYSRPGNGLSHHVHLERMATPGRTLLGASGHTQMLGAVGMLAFAADAIEVAAAMAGEPYPLAVPEVVRVVLHGRAKPFVSPLDIGLELIRRRGIGGLSEVVLEFDGPGVRALGVYERATIAQLGPTLGAITTVFPSDEKTRIFLQRQRRSKSWRRIEADNDATYLETEDIDLAALEPLALISGDPDSVRPVREIAGEPIQEVVVGSCANASVRDLLALSGIMRGKKVNADCALTVSPGSRQALEVLARGDSGRSGNGLADLISAGVRILESGCGPCRTPNRLPAGSTSVRTFISSMTTDDVRTLVVSPETAAACAIHGQITDPRKLRRPPRIKLPRQMPVDDSMIIKPKVETRGPIARLMTPPRIPAPTNLDDELRAFVAQRLGHGARLDRLAAEDATGAEEDAATPQCLVAGQSLGYRGLTTPEVGLSQRRKGLQVVIAEGFDPTCAISLAHAGVAPLRFVDAADYERVKAGDELLLPSLADHLRQGEPIPVSVAGDGVEFEVACDLDEHSLSVLISGGLLGFLKQTVDAAG